MGAHHGGSLRVKSSALWLGLVLNAVLAAVEFSFGVSSGSLGLLSDAGHTAVDVLALGLSLLAVSFTGRPATVRKTFGWHRAGVLAALANAALTVAMALIIAIEASIRLRHPHPVPGMVVFLVALAGMLTNGLGSVFLARHAGEDLNMRSALLHLAADAIASFGVAVAGAAIVVIHGASWADPAASLFVAVLIGIQGLRLVKEATNVLLEFSPRNLDLVDMTRAMEESPGVESVHDLHAWSLSSELRALSAHVVLRGHPTLEEAQTVAGKVKAVLAQVYGIAHATLELECETCIEDGVPDCVIEPPHGGENREATGRHSHASARTIHFGHH